MSRRMTTEEWRAFVLASPARTGKIALVRQDGRPLVTPIWVDLDDDGTVVFTTGADTAKAVALRRDARCAICFDDERPPFAFVIVEGRAEISEDLDELLVWATRIGGRYMGAAAAEQFGRRNAVPGELLVRLRPEKVNAQRGISE